MPIVLIVEDDGLLAYDLTALIEEQTGAEVVVAPTLRAANAEILRRPEIALALLDIQLPDGVSFAFARDLSARQIPFVFLSGNARFVPEDLQAHRFISKPYNRAMIIELLSGTDWQGDDKPRGST